MATQHTPVQLFPISDYVNEELAARGWTARFAVRNLDGDRDENELWLDFMCCRDLWIDRDDVTFTADDATRLAQIFGVDAGTFTRLHEAFLRAKAVAATANWIRCADKLPPDGEPVATKIDDANGVRNEQSLKRSGRLWFFTDGSMYVYYTPTHWKPIPVGGDCI
jgi:hypothetical protein